MTPNGDRERHGAASDRGEPAGAAGDSPRVAVVLLNCRAQEEEDTVACVASLRESTHRNLEIVLVDNGSPTEVGARLRERLPDVVHLETGANLGFTGGNNRGIELALERGCDHVWVLNNDTEVEPDCLERLLETARREPRVGAVGGKILYHDPSDRIWFGGGYFSPLRGIGFHRGEGERDDPAADGEVEEVTFLTGCSMLIPAAVLREVGGFAEDFFIYVEDVELSVRLRSAGYRLLYQPKARLYHKISMPEPPIPPHKIVLRDRNRRRLVRRRLSPLQRALFALFFYPSRAAHAAKYLLRGDGERAKAIWRGAVEF